MCLRPLANTQARIRSQGRHNDPFPHPISNITIVVLKSSSWIEGGPWAPGALSKPCVQIADMCCREVTIGVSHCSLLPTPRFQPHVVVADGPESVDPSGL